MEEDFDGVQLLMENSLNKKDNEDKGRWSLVEEKFIKKIFNGRCFEITGI